MLILWIKKQNIIRVKPIVRTVLQILINKFVFWEMVKMCQSKADIYPERALICLTAELKGKKNKTFTYLMDQKVLKTSILYDHNFFLNSRDLIDSSFCMQSCLVLSTFFLPYLPFTALCWNNNLSRFAEHGTYSTPCCCGEGRHQHCEHSSALWKD